MQDIPPFEEVERRAYEELNNMSEEEREALWHSLVELVYEMLKAELKSGRRSAGSRYARRNADKSTG